MLPVFSLLHIVCSYLLLYYAKTCILILQWIHFILCKLTEWMIVKRNSQTYFTYYHMWQKIELGKIFLSWTGNEIVVNGKKNVAYHKARRNSQENKSYRGVFLLILAKALRTVLNNILNYSKAYLKPSRTFTTELFAKIVNS